MKLRELLDLLYKEIRFLETENKALRWRLWKDEKPIGRDSPVERLAISLRLWNCIRSTDCETIEDVINRTASEWSKCKNLGQKSLEELRLELFRSGLLLKGDDLKEIQKIVEVAQQMYSAKVESKK